MNPGCQEWRTRLLEAKAYPVPGADEHRVVCPECDGLARKLERDQNLLLQATEPREAASLDFADVIRRAEAAEASPRRAPLTLAGAAALAVAVLLWMPSRSTDRIPRSYPRADSVAPGGPAAPSVPAPEASEPKNFFRDPAAPGNPFRSEAIASNPFEAPPETENPYKQEYDNPWRRL